MPPRSQPSASKLIMPRLLRPSAGINSFGRTLCRLTARGTAMPCSFPSVLIHMHRALWMWPAIIRTVRRGAPGTGALHSSGGNCSKRKTVTRLLVLHAASSISRWSSAEFITSLHKLIKLAPVGWNLCEGQPFDAIRFSRGVRMNVPPLPQGSVKPPPMSLHIPNTVLPLTVWHVLRFAFEMCSVCPRPLTVSINILDLNY